MHEFFLLSTFARTFDDSTSTGATSTESGGSGSEPEGSECFEIAEEIDEMLQQVSKKLSEVQIAEREGGAGSLPATVADARSGRDMPLLIDLTVSDDEN